MSYNKGVVEAAYAILRKLKERRDREQQHKPRDGVVQVLTEIIDEIESTGVVLKPDYGVSLQETERGNDDGSGREKSIEDKFLGDVVRFPPYEG